MYLFCERQFLVKNRSFFPFESSIGLQIILFKRVPLYIKRLNYVEAKSFLALALSHKLNPIQSLFEVENHKIYVV